MQGQSETLADEGNLEKRKGDNTTILVFDCRNGIV